MFVYQHNLIDLLDRKFDFINKSLESNDANFMLDLSSFIRFLLSDNQLQYFSQILLVQFARKIESYTETVKNEVEEIKTLADRFLNLFSAFDDSKKYTKRNISQAEAIEYHNSFARFYEIAKELEIEDVRLESSEIMKDDSTPSEMLDIFGLKIVTVKNLIKELEQNSCINFEEYNEIKEILDRFDALVERRKYYHINWVNMNRIDPGKRLLELSKIIKQINPDPSEKSVFEQVVAHLRYSWVQYLANYKVTKYTNYLQSTNITQVDLIGKKDLIKDSMKRVYEAIRDKIGTNLMIEQVLNRYKVRTIWYDGSRIRDLIEKNKSKNEHLLTLELAKYLYDNGLPTFYKLKAGPHEFDLVDMQNENPLVIEVKVYKSSSGKPKVIQGISQLHSYLNNLSAKINIYEGYYILFRLGGPLYELPKPLKIGNYVINWIIIDIGESSKSGSRQEKPVNITIEQILKGLGKNEKKTPKQKKATKGKILMKGKK